MARSINVIDMYHGNNVPDGGFAKLRANGVFAIIHKASQGSHYRDPAFAARVPQIVAADQLAGAYHFIDNSDPRTQADNFIASSGLSADGPDISVWADYEDEQNGHSATLQQLMAFCKIIDTVKPGVQIGIYSGNRIRETLTPHSGGHQDAAMSGVMQFFQARRLWLAEYGPIERIPYPWNLPIAKSSNASTPLPAPGVFMWQFTETGRVAPLPGKTDGNFFDGTFEELKARWLA